MNIVVLVLMLGSAELLGRFLVKTLSTGQVRRANGTVIQQQLGLRNWSHFATDKKKILQRMARTGSFLTYDPVLGWTIPPSHSDETGLYFSSAEGLRSPRVGMAFADLRTRHSTVAEQSAFVRVALVGNSFTFGSEVRCEESWAHVLEALLQSQAQMLNFGVPIYGLDQALLRYEQDVRPWKPQIVVIGIISQMVGRITNIYPFLKDPFVDIPFLRPQLVLKDDKPTSIYNPVPHPEQIFTSQAINELPYLDLDDYYRPFLWERGGFWYLFERSYIFRFINSLWTFEADQEKEKTSQEALEMGRFLIQYFVREVRKDGAVPLVVFFPEKHELLRSAEPHHADPDAVRILNDARITYVDPSACLLRVEPSAIFMKGRHYSPQANAEVAHCLEPVLQGIIVGLRAKP
jgi:hypothetical protein